MYGSAQNHTETITQLDGVTPSSVRTTYTERLVATDHRLNRHEKGQWGHFEEMISWEQHCGDTDGTSGIYFGRSMWSLSSKNSPTPKQPD